MALFQQSWLKVWLFFSSSITREGYCLSAFWWGGSYRGSSELCRCLPEELMFGRASTSAPPRLRNFVKAQDSHLRAAVRPCWVRMRAAKISKRTKQAVQNSKCPNLFICRIAIAYRADRLKGHRKGLWNHKTLKEKDAKLSQSVRCRRRNQGFASAQPSVPLLQSNEFPTSARTWEWLLGAPRHE